MLALISTCPRSQTDLLLTGLMQGVGAPVGAMLVQMELESLALQQNCGPMEVRLSLTSHSGTADSYTAAKATKEAGLPSAPHHGLSQTTLPLLRARGWCQASRHQQAQGIQC